MDNLEQIVKRRSFLKKTISTLGSIALAAYLGLTAGLSTGCKNSNNPPNGSKLYTISCQNSSIFDGGNIGGAMTLKYSGGGSVKIGSGGSATINGESSLYISDLVIEAPGYINAYVLTQDSNRRQLTTRDANGFKAFTITDANITIINYVIPSDFDTVLFAKCIGNSIGGADSGDGTVQRYDHPDKTVKVGTLPHPDKPTALTIEYDQRAAQIINDAAQGTLVLDYIGEISSLLDNGCTHLVDNQSYFHGVVNVSGNAYQKSGYYTPNVDTGVDISTVIEEMMNSSTGIRFDAGGAGSPYIGDTLLPEGRRAIILVNKMPLGFKFSTTGIPAVNTQDFQGPESLQQGLPGSIESQQGIIPEHPGINYHRDKRVERDIPDKKIRD